MNITNKRTEELRAIVLWAIVLLGYLLFVTEWFVIDRIGGQPAGLLNEQTTKLPALTGWKSSFFSAEAGTVAAAATNWTITLLRAVGSILCGIAVVKFGYRYAVIIMIALMCLCFPFLIIGDPLGGKNQLTLIRPLSETVKNQLTGLHNQLHTGQLLGPIQLGDRVILADGTPVNLVQGIGGNKIGTSSSIAGYALFIMFRTTLAVGGTTLITYSQPIIATISSNRKKSILNNTNQWGFNSGIMIAFTPFLFETVSNSAAKYWVYVMAVMILMVFVVLCLFAWFSKQLNNQFPQAVKKQQKLADPNAPSASALLKKKTTWKLIALYSVWLILVVYPLTSSWYTTLTTISPVNAQASLKTGQYSTGLPTLSIAWVLGYVVGYFVLAPFAKTIFERKQWLIFLYLMSALSIIFVALFAGTLGVGSIAGFSLITLFSFVGGAFAWSISSIILITPHEFKEYKKQDISVVYGFIWGFGYLFYTVFDFTNSLILQAPQFVNGASANLLAGAIVGIVIFISVILSANWYIVYLPPSWIKQADNWTVPMTKKWKFYDWRFVVANKNKNRYIELLK